MGDGWETSRSRGADHRDYVVVALGRPARIERVEVDFTYFVLNNPVALRILGASAAPGADAPTSEHAWFELLARTPAKAHAGRVLHLAPPDLRAADAVFSHVRLETYPDGGANRLRVFGRAV
jgi:allantoicase